MVSKPEVGGIQGRTMALTRTDKVQIGMIAFFAAAAFQVISTASPAVAKQVKEFVVRLQDSTPGTAQAGSANLTGTMKAGQFQGGGAGISGVNADLLDGLNSSAFAAASHTHSASAIVSGTLNDARLSSNVPLLGNTQGWSGRNSFTHTMNIFAGDGSGLTGVNADRLDGLDSTAFLTSIPNPLSLVGTQGGLPIIKGENLSAAAGSSGVQGTAAGSGYGAYGQSVSGRGVFGWATSATGVNHGVFGQSDSTSGRGVNGFATAASGTTYGGVFQSDSPTGRGVFGYANADSGVNMGGYFDSDSSAGYGIFATSAGTYGSYSQSTLAAGEAYGGFFESLSTSGRGIRARSTSTSGTTYGGYFESASTAGRGVFGHTTATSGTTYGGYFDCDSPDGYGVYAISQGPVGVYGRGSDYGGWFEAVGQDAVSVAGVANATGALAGLFESMANITGPTLLVKSNYPGIGNSGGGEFYSSSSDGIALLGRSWWTGGSDTPYGVMGTCSTATLGYGVFASGDLGASGVKSFRIDHPFDPENKYLLHYSSESPFPQNFYSGNVVTDGEGKAWVQLPEYFGEINRNFKYQLTVVEDGESDSFVVAKVARKIRNNRFMVMTSAPNTEVSWRIEADRNDRRIATSRPKDVREKAGIERGKYQHPEYYGLPSEDNAARMPARVKPPK